MNFEERVATVLNNKQRDGGGGDEEGVKRQQPRAEIIITAEVNF